MVFWWWFELDKWFEDMFMVCFWDFWVVIVDNYVDVIVVLFDMYGDGVLGVLCCVVDEVFDCLF